MPSSSIATAGLSLFALAALLASTVPEPVSAHGLHEQRSSLGVTRRRHHARLATQSKRDNEKRGDVSTLVTGLGMGTLYFDVNGGGTCGPVNVSSGSPCFRLLLLNNMLIRSPNKTGMALVRRNERLCNV